MPIPAAIAFAPWAARLLRSVARAAAVVAADAPASTTAGLARHGIGHRAAASLTTGRRELVDGSGAVVGLARFDEGRRLARLLDLRVPLRAAVAIALGGAS